MHKFHDEFEVIFNLMILGSLGCVFGIVFLDLSSTSSSYEAHRLLIDDSIVRLPRHISPPYRHHNVVMMRQVPTQTNVLRILVRTQVTGESTLTAALKAHVSCQVVL